MADLRRLLETLADDGTPRGAAEVLRRARVQLEHEVSGARRPRSPGWLAAAAAVVAGLVVAASLITLRDDGDGGAPRAGAVNTARLGQWTLVPPARSGLAPGTRIRAVVPAEHGLVAVGSVDTPTGLPTQAAWTSTDGRRWQRAWSATFGPGVLDLVAPTKDGLVAVGPTQGRRGSRSVWHSIDGTRWERVTQDAPGGIRSVVAGGPGLVAAGFTRGQSRSGAARAAIWTSAKGKRWSAVASRDARFPRGRIAGLVPEGTGLVAVGTDESTGSAQGRATVWSSPDGTRWHRVGGRAGLARAAVTGTTPIADRDGELRLLAAQPGDGAAGDVPCARAGLRRAVWGSDGGRHWNRVSRVGAAPGASHLVGAGDWWLAGGRRGPCGTGRSVVYLSADGRRWTEARTGAARAGAAGAVQAMAPTGDGAIVVVGRARSPRQSPAGPDVWLWTAPELRP